MDKKLTNVAQVLSDYCNSIDCDSCPIDRILFDGCRCPIDHTRSVLREILQADNAVFDKQKTSELQIDGYDTEAEYYMLQYERLRNMIKNLAEQAEFEVSEKPEPIFDVDDDEDE